MKADIVSNLNWGKIVWGIAAGIVTLIIFSVDRIDFLAGMYERNSAFNYSIIITSLYILGVMNIIGGFKREYTLSLTYIISMILYDLLTNDLPTLLFAGISFISLVFGALLSTVVSRLMGSSESPQVENSDSSNKVILLRPEIPCEEAVHLQVDIFTILQLEVPQGSFILEALLLHNTQ